MNKRKFLTGFLVAVFVLTTCVAFAAVLERKTYDEQNDFNAVAFLNTANSVTIDTADNWVASVDASGVYASRFWFDPNTGTGAEDSTEWWVGAAPGLDLSVSIDGTLYPFDVAFFRGGLGLQEKYIHISSDADEGFALRFWYGLDGFDGDPDGDYANQGFDFEGLYDILLSEDAKPGMIRFAPCCGAASWCCLDLNSDYLLISADSSDLYDTDWEDRWALDPDGDLATPWVLNTAADSVDVMVYIPCYEAEKRWQLTPYDKRVHFDDMILVNPADLKAAERGTDCKLTVLDENVTSLFSTHFLYAGPYVVEKTPFFESGELTSDWGDAWPYVASADFLAERVLNFSPFGMLPMSDTEDHWKAVVETSADIDVNQMTSNVAQTLAEICEESDVAADFYHSFINASSDIASEALLYRARRIENDTVASNDFAQYILYQDDAATHTGWYSYLESDPRFALSPGFAQYLATFPGYEEEGCLWASDRGFVDDAQASRFHMFYYVKGADGTKAATDFCEFTEISYREWWEHFLCYDICGETDSHTEQYLDDDECWLYTPMSVDAVVWSEVRTIISGDSVQGWDEEDIDTFGLANNSASQECDYVCGGELGWFHNDNAQNIAPIVELTAGAHVCLETEFGLQVTEYHNCNEKMGVLPLKVEFLLREDQVCCDETVAAINAKLDLLGAHRVCGATDIPVYKDDNGTERTIEEVANMGPIDAFLGTTEETNDLLQILFMGVDGKIYDLVKIAEDSFTAEEKEDYPWLGRKNYFRVWPQTLDVDTDTSSSMFREMGSVKEAWDNDEQVEFSFYAVFVDADPVDGEYVVAKNGYFVIYTGAPVSGEDFQLLDGKVALACGYGGSQPTPEPKDPEIVSITSDPQGSMTDANCASDDELTKDSFSDAAWTEILKALDIAAADEGDYDYDVTCKDCDDYVVSLDAGLSLDVKVTYEEGEPAPAAGTYRSVFVKDVVNSLYDVLAAEELTIAVEKDVEGVIYEGGAYDADASEDTLKAGFCLLEVVATPKTVTPTTTPSGGGGSGCSFGFAPLALLLLAPLALLKK